MLSVILSLHSYNVHDTMISQRILMILTHTKRGRRKNQQIWNEYTEQASNRNGEMEAKRADILASGCMGYTALMCSKAVDELTGVIRIAT